MSLTDELKVINNKIKVNQAQYDLDREADKISALSSVELKIYKYLTCKNLGCKPGVVEKLKFEYSQLSKMFHKGFDENDKKEGLLKRLKHIESKDEKQLNAINHQEDSLKRTGKGRNMVVYIK